MANRLFDSIIIIDSGMGNLSAVGGTSSNITNYSIQAIGFWASTTLGNLVLTGADTGLDHVAHFSFINHLGSNFLASQQLIQFPGLLKLNSLKCPTVTACTGFIYLA